MAPPFVAIGVLLVADRLFLVMGVLASLAEGLGIAMMIPLLQGNTAHGTDGRRFCAGSTVGRGVSGGIPEPGHRRADSGGSPDQGRAGLRLYQFSRLDQGKHVCTRYAPGCSGDSWPRRKRIWTRSKAAPCCIPWAAVPNRPQSVLTTLWLLLNVCTILVFSALLMAIAWQLTLAVVATLLVLSRLVRLATQQVGQLARAA